MSELDARPPTQDPPAGRLKRFFWFCAGADAHVLNDDRCAPDRNKYAGIGATVFLTAVLAALSGSYALQTIFGAGGGGAEAYLLSASLGLLWGVVIFNFDRNIVLSMRKEPGGLPREVVVALPRLAAAVVISLVITAPLEVKLFDDQIRRRTQAEGEAVRQRVRQGHERHIDEQIAALKSRNDQLEGEVKDKEKQERHLYDEFMSKALRDRESRARGILFETRWAWNYQQQFRDDLNRFRTDARRMVAQNEAAVEQLKKKREQPPAAQVPPPEGPGSFITRLGTLRRLAAEDETTAAAFWLITALFIIIETSPVLVKLLSRRGAYDALTAGLERAALFSEEKQSAALSEKWDDIYAARARARRLLIDFEMQTYRDLLRAVKERADFEELREAVAAGMVRMLAARASESLREVFASGTPAVPAPTPACPPAVAPPDASQGAAPHEVPTEEASRGERSLGHVSYPILDR